MGIYIEGLEKPKNCWSCPCYDRGMAGQYPACCGITDRGVFDIWDKLPSWCPIVEVPKEEFEMGREAVERIKKELDEAALYGKSKRQQAYEWNTHRFYNMDSALTRIEELARQMQEEAKKIGDIVNEGFTVKQYGGYGDESRTEDA